MSLDTEHHRIDVVRGTEVLPGDTSRGHREKLARLTLDAMRRFAGLLDTRGNVVEVNQGALDAVGLQFADVEGKPLWTTVWWQASPEATQGLRDAFARALRGEAVQWETEICCSADGRETFAAEASLVPVTDDDGVIVFIAVETRDITQAKAQEREVAQKNVELQGLLERIRELDEVKTQLFANVGRELRTPLGLILGPAQSLVDDDGTTLGLAQRRENAQLIARNARLLLKQVNDLLDMSKLEAGKLKLDLQDTDVAGLLRRLGSHFAALAAERNIDYAIEAPPTVLRRRRCRQAAARGHEPAGQRLQVHAARRPRALHAAAAARRTRDRGRRLRPGCAAAHARGDLRALPPVRPRSARQRRTQGRRAPDSAWPSPGSSSRCTRAASRCATPGSAARASRS